MKKAIAAGFLALVSSLWAIAICAYVEMNLVNVWVDSQFWESAVRQGMIFPLILSLIVLFASVAALIAAYFRKDR